MNLDNSARITITKHFQKYKHLEKEYLTKNNSDLIKIPAATNIQLKSRIIEHFKVNFCGIDGPF